jgi:hypothetical protein
MKAWYLSVEVFRYLGETSNSVKHAERSTQHAARRREITATKKSDKGCLSQLVRHLVRRSLEGEVGSSKSDGGDDPGFLRFEI